MAVVQISESKEGDTKILLSVQELILQRAPYFHMGPVNLVCAKGSMTLVTGPNGSGKTTLLRSLAGLFPPKKGIISFSCAVAKEGPACLLIESGKGLHAFLTVKQHLHIWATLSGPTAQYTKEEQCEQIDKAIKMWELGSIKKCFSSTLSQGQKQRVLLARLSLSRHLIWLLDEPFQALDKKACTTLRDVLRAHLDKGGMIVGVCHENSFPHISQSIEVGHG